MSGEQFSLVWNSFPTNLSSGLYTLLTDEHLVDVTLTAEGQILRAHKLILSVCSSYFRELFKGNTCKHPIVILKDVNYRDLSAMLHFMYQGEVNIKQEDISSFLKLAETLQIKGLTKEKHVDAPEDHQTNDERPECPLKTEAPDADPSCDRPISSPPPIADDLPPRADGDSFVRVTSSSSFHRSDVDSDTENAMRSISSIINDNYGNQNELPMINDDDDDEPLDCTASEMRDIGASSTSACASAASVAVEANTEEPLNYRFTANDSSQNFTVPNSQQLSYSQDYQKESLGVNSAQPASSRDFHGDGASCARGKRTVRGIPGSSLPLETTLRVVSELGPTLRVERGKVVRMYSCPWCLRHFTRKENLKLHVRYIHGPLESLTCKLCGNKYKNSNSLRVHSYLYHNAKRNKHTKPPSLVGGNM